MISRWWRGFLQDELTSVVRVIFLGRTPVQDITIKSFTFTKNVYIMSFNLGLYAEHGHP